MRPDECGARFAFKSGRQVECDEKAGHEGNHFEHDWGISEWTVDGEEVRECQPY
jgi:hypothetical protein